jgi:hypothetical protein
MAPDELALRGTAWLSLLAWAASEAMGAARTMPVREVWSRRCFAAGALLLFAHTALAFHLRHGWSQVAAQREIARQTAEVTGLATGAGLYVNYAFLFFWAAEAAWWGHAPASFRGRSPALRWAQRAVFLFMFANGAVVFGKGPVRAFGVVVLLAVVSSWYRDRMAPGPGGREERAGG